MAKLIISKKIRSGVCEDFRKQGIASLLLENLISHLTSDPAFNNVKALYLHVLTTNSQAITFYEHRYPVFILNISRKCMKADKGSPDS